MWTLLPSGMEIDTGTICLPETASPGGNFEYYIKDSGFVLPPFSPGSFES